MVIVTSFAQDKGLISRFIARFHYLGSISYSIYLNQITVLMVLGELMPTQEYPVLLRLAAFLLLVVGVSHFTYTYVENPLRGLGNKLSSGNGTQ
jgi:peptidoglycan/LPS O-acetylase OafA/YrhL